MPTLLAVPVLLLVCGGAAVLTRGRPRLASWLGASAPVASLAVAAPSILTVMAGARPLQLQLTAAAPLGAVALGLDPLSALFLLIILTIGACAALFGRGYLRDSTASAVSWFFFDALLASMVLIVLARHAILFLLAWETMALTSFFLVAHHHERAEVRRAAWTYLVAAHLGSLCLLPMFFLLGGPTLALDFASLGHGLSGGAATGCFVLALVGFGTKAGLVPFHVWLPEAHPVAPSHVSALLSAVMIKMGIYGLLRTLLFLGAPPLSWAWVLLTVGCVSALLGVLLALAQGDLKRLLAYSSVENAGIVLIGVGIGVAGIASGSTHLATIGFAAALVHTCNHAVFKALLFLGAGSVLHATGTTEMDDLGGVARRLPWTAVAVLVGCLGICCLPPLGGFVGELLLLLGAVEGIRSAPGALTLPLAATLGTIGLVSALAMATFTKAFGIVFLGTPRNAAHAVGRETRRLLPPLLFLAVLCLVLGVTAPWLIRGLGGVLSEMTLAPVRDEVGALAHLLDRMTAAVVALVLVALLGGLVRASLMGRRAVQPAPTWNCGYLASSPSMQYTASSFSQPIVDLFGSLLRTRKHVEPPEVHFPATAHVATETPDLSREEIYEPVFEAIERSIGRIHVLQHGRVHAYVLGIVLTLLALLLWQVR